MASASDPDQLDVQKIVHVLVSDAHLLINKGLLWGILEIPCAEVITAEDQYGSGRITIRDLFTRMISSWRSKTNGSRKDICDILNANGFKTAGG
jgi:hypothetical protein